MTIYILYVIAAINLKQSLKGEQIPVASIRYYSILVGDISRVLMG